MISSPVFTGRRRREGERTNYLLAHSALRTIMQRQEHRKYDNIQKSGSGKIQDFESGKGNAA